MGWVGGGEDVEVEDCRNKGGEGCGEVGVMFRVLGRWWHGRGGGRGMKRAGRLAKALLLAGGFENGHPQLRSGRRQKYT